jgi:hypothetical protein
MMSPSKQPTKNDLIILGEQVLNSDLNIWYCGTKIANHLEEGI